MCGAYPSYMEAVGKFLGYKSCCVQGFDRTWNADTRKKYPLGPWQGTGHIPCVDCADAIMKSPTGWAVHLQLIAQDRKAKTPFPADVGTARFTLDFELTQYLNSLDCN